MTTWTCECGYICQHDWRSCLGCGKPRPVETSEEERDALTLWNNACAGVCHQWVTWTVDDFRRDVSHCRSFILVFYRAARAPLTEKLQAAEEKHAREMTEQRERAVATVADLKKALLDEGQLLEQARQRIAELKAANENCQKQFKAVCVKLDELEAAKSSAPRLHDVLEQLWREVREIRPRVRVPEGAKQDEAFQAEFCELGTYIDAFAVLKLIRSYQRQKPSAPAGAGPKLRRLEALLGALEVTSFGMDRGILAAAREDFAEIEAKLVDELHAYAEGLERTVAELRGKLAETEKGASWWEESHDRELSMHHAWVKWQRETMGVVTTGPTAEEDGRSQIAAKLAESEKSTRCPADEMSDEGIGEKLVNANVSTVANVSSLSNVGRRARELFTSKAETGKEGSK